MATVAPVAERRRPEDPVRELELAKASAFTWEMLDGPGARHTARTLIKQGGLRVVLIAMGSGAVIPEHHTGADFSVAVLAGRDHLSRRR